MVNTDIKFYTSSNLNAPQLDNAFGSMIGVLNACLIDGFSSQTITSLIYSNDKATATFATDHNFMKYQVITITGATQAEYNIETKIIAIPSPTSITFNLNSVPSITTATGTISCKLSSLGWEKPFSSNTALGGGRAAYRSKDETIANRPFLRVIDEKISSYNNDYAKYAKVGIVENMTDIDTLSGAQAPYTSSAVNRNWTATGSGTTLKNGWSKWYYYSFGDGWYDNTLLSDYTNRVGKWFIIGNKSCFYIINSIVNYYTEGDPTFEKILDRCYLYGFGAFTPLVDDDLFTHFLSSTVNWDTIGNISSRAAGFTEDISLGSSDPTYNNNCSISLQRSFKKTVYGKATTKPVSYYNMFPSGLSYSNDTLPPNFTGTILQKPLILERATDSTFFHRGFIPLLKTIPHGINYTELQIIEQNNKVYIAKKVYGNTLYNATVLFDLGSI